MEDEVTSIQLEITEDKIATAKRVRTAAHDALDQIKELLGITKTEDERPAIEYGRPTYGYSATSGRGQFFAQVETHPSPYFKDSENPAGVNEVVSAFEKVLREENASMIDFLA